MSSRNSILQAIKNNKPALVALPVIPLFAFTHPLQQRFTEILSGIGGKVITGSLQDVSLYLEAAQLNDNTVVNGMEHLNGYNILPYASMANEAVEVVDTVCLPGQLGVAENGSIWVSETNMVHRMLPFICQHLVLVIDAEGIVATMHDAYKKIDVAQEGFGVFIAGPSKTADIEQSLVIGAHGPLSLTVFLV